MCPEYGATVAIFPIDEMTLDYLRFTGRDAAQVALVEAYAKAQGLFRTDATPDAAYTDTLELDLGTVEPSLAGPRRPQDRVPLDAREGVVRGGAARSAEGRQEAGRRRHGGGGAARGRGRRRPQLEHGSVVIAAITSCTNTSNPSVMIARGPRREEGRRARAHEQAVGEDEPRARLEGRDRLPRRRPACSRTSTRSASTSSATAARRASATAGRCPTRSPPRCASAASSSVRCCRAIATSRAASSRTCARTTSRRRRSSSPTRWRAR